MTYKPCKYQCGAHIEWNDNLKYYIEETTGERHFCPNFKRRTKAEQELARVARQVEQESTTNPNPSVFKKNDAFGKIAEFETQYATDQKEVNRRLAANEQAIRGMVAQINFITGDGKIVREPKKHPEDPDKEIED